MAEPVPTPAQPTEVKAYSPSGEKITVRADDVAQLQRAGGRLASEQEVVDDKYGSKLNPVAQVALGSVGIGLNPQLRAIQLGGEQGLTGGLSKVFQKEAIRALAGDNAAQKFVQQQDEISRAYSTENKVGEVAGMVGGALLGGSAGGAALRGAGAAGQAGALGRAALTGPIGGITALGEVAESAVGQALKGYASRGVLQNMGAQGLKLGMRGAVESGLMGALDQTTDDLFHNKPLAAEKIFIAAGHNALWGLAGGAALGAAGAGLSSLAGRAAALRGAGATVAEQVDGTLARELPQAEAALVPKAIPESPVVSSAPLTAEAIEKQEREFAAAQWEKIRNRNNGFRTSTASDLTSAQEKLNVTAVAQGAAEKADLSATKAVAAADRKAGAGFLDEFSSESAVRSLYGTKTDFTAARDALGKDGLRELGDLMLQRDIVRAGESVVDSMPRLELARNQVGEALGEVVKKSDSRIPVADLLNLAKQTQQGLLKKGPQFVDAADKVMDAVTKLTRNFEATGAVAQDGTIAVSELLKSRRGLESIAYDTGKLGTTNAKKAISGLSRDIEEKLVMANLEKANPAASKLYAPLKREYQLFSEALDVAKSGTSRIEGNQTFSLTSKLAAAAGLLASGNPLVAGASLFGMKAVQERGSATAAVLARRLSERTAAQALMHTADDIFARAYAGVMKWSGKAEAAEGILTNQEAKNAARAAAPAKKTGSVISEANKALKEVNEAKANPVATQARIASAVEQLARNAPETAKALTETMQRSIAFIASKAPSQAAPFAPLSPMGRTNTMDPVEASRFLRYVDAAKDPQAALARIERGTVRVEDVEALKFIAPAAYQQLRVRVLTNMQQMQESGKPMAYSARIKVSLLADIQGDATLQPEYLSQLQKNVTVAVNAGGGPQGPRRPVSNPAATKLTGLDRLEES